MRYVVRASLDGRLLAVAEHCRFPVGLRPATLPPAGADPCSTDATGRTNGIDAAAATALATATFVSREKSFGFLDPLTRYARWPAWK